MSTVSNKNLMEKGYPPTNRDGEKIYLQHVGFHVGNPIAELTKSQCMVIAKHSVETDDDIDRENIARKKRNYWKDRINL